MNTQLSFKNLTLTTLILIFLTLILDNFINKYEHRDKFSIFIDENYSKPVNASKRNVTATQLLSTDRKQYSEFSYLVKIYNNKYDYIKITTDVKISNINPGNSYWKTARLAMYFLDINKNKIKHHKTTVKYFYDDQNWENINHTFKIPKSTAFVKPTVEFLNSTGSLYIKNTELFYVKESTIYKIFRHTLQFLWGILTSLSLYILIKNIEQNHFKYIFLITSFALILGIIIPHEIKLSLINWLNIYGENKIFGYDVYSIYIIKYPIKLGHFIIFFALSFISYTALSNRYKNTCILISLTLFALSTETLQLLIIGRTAKITDFLIDFSGIALGLFIFFTLKNSRT
ncbi:MAG: VanZ family protein [Pseudomonadota bacterium]